MPRSVRSGFTAFLLLATLCGAAAADRKMEARLVWGTNEEKPQDPAQKPLDADLAKKLCELPLKWKNFFEVNRKVFTINEQTYTNIVMSKECSIEMKDKGANNVTVKLYSNGKASGRVDKPLPKGDVLTIGGDAKDKSAWLIMVRPVNGTEAKSPQLKETKPAGAIAVPAKPVPAK